MIDKLYVVIPSYNRLSNLKLTLTALNEQNYFNNTTSRKELNVIIADDGSTDGTREFIERAMIDKGVYSNLELNYIFVGPNLGFRAGRARNIGIAQIPLNQDNRLWMIDSDNILNPNALSHMLNVMSNEAFKNVVIIGLYHWAKESNLTPEDIKNFENVMALVPNEKSTPPIPGTDGRTSHFHSEISTDHIITEYDGLGFWSGNVSWPVDLFWHVGGFDEILSQGEDAELGQKMRINEIPVFQFAQHWAVHFHHERDVQKAIKEVQESIEYIDKKYGIGKYAKLADAKTDPRDKTLMRWYTKEKGGRIVKIEGDQTLYVLTEFGDFYGGLTAPQWINMLGFSPTDIETIDKSELDGLQYAGGIRSGNE